MYHAKAYSAASATSPLAGTTIPRREGVAGAMVAGFLGRTLGWYREGEPVGLFTPIIGAIVLLGLYRLVAARRAL